MTWFYWAHFALVIGLLASAGWLVFLARVHDRE